MSRAATDPRSRALRALGAGTTALPRLVHHDGTGARIELSGRVLLNWTAKAADLLAAEFDVQPGDVVALDLPAGHWRAAYWALAAWTLGASLDVTPGADGDVVVCRAEAARDASGQVVAVTTAALARRAEVDLPPGALDEAAVLATYADTPTDPADIDPADVALRDGAARTSFADLAAPLPQGGPEDDAAGSGAGAGVARSRVLLTGGTGGADPAACLRVMVAAWAADAAVVVAPPGADAAALAALAAQEGTGATVDVSR